MLHGRTDSMLACHITIHVLLQGLVNQRPGALLDILVGIPGDTDAMQASLLNYYLKRIEEVRLCNAFCCMPAAILVSASATIDIIALNVAVSAVQVQLLLMQAEYGKYLPRLRSLERLNGPAFEQLKADWSKDPNNFACCKDADEGIWSIYDQHCDVWVTVHLLLNYCDCESDLSVCHHQQLARHIITVGNNPVSACQDIPVDLQRHAVYAAGNCSSAEADIAICYKAELTILFKVCARTLSYSKRGVHDMCNFRYETLQPYVWHCRASCIA